MQNTVKQRITDFLLEVDCKLCTPLRNEQRRFPNVECLLERFRHIRNIIDRQLQQDNQALINQAIEITNELCVAKWILNPERECNNLIYEPPVQENSGTGKVRKTIDFCASMKSGQTVYFDVKTIQPDKVNAWAKFEKIKERGLLPENFDMDLEEQSLGGETWHDSFSSRGRMLEYTVELEKKINNYRSGDKTFFVMIFCSNGFDWHRDELEDFADFYSTGCHNPDDPYRKMEQFDLRQKKIKFQNNITAFCYLERPKTSLRGTKVVCPVQGPWITNRWRRTEGRI